MWQTGKNFEEEAFGLINQNKEQELASEIIYKEAAMELKKSSWEVIKKHLRENPEEKEKVNELLKQKIFQYFVSNPQMHPYDIDVSNKIVKQCQPRRMRPLAEDLYYKVFELMNLSELEDDNETPKNLKFYTAVGSKSDCPHGVDGFLTYDYLGEEITVSIDITINTTKTRYKADILQLFDVNAADSRDKWEKPVLELAKKVVAKFQEKINLNNNLKKQ